MDELEEFEFRARAEREKSASNGGRATEPQTVMQETPPAKESSLLDRYKQAQKDAVGGLVRGAGSIGATILAPADMVNDALAGKGLSLESNRQRRADIDYGLNAAIGSNPDSLIYQGGKLAGEIAGTAGVGGVLARGAQTAGAAPGMVNALRSSGMIGDLTGQTGFVTNALTRALGGAVAGGASAGLVDPESAGIGAAIGGIVPIATIAAGRTGNAIRRLIRGPAQTPDMAAAVQQARLNGYVIPPTQANQTLLNRTLEGFSGKITTAQNASARNQDVTNRLVADTLGVPRDVPITIDVLNQVRRNAGNAYQAVSGAGQITPGPQYNQAIDRILAPYQQAAQGFPNAAPSPVIQQIEALRSNSFDASSAVAQLRNVRDMADAAFRRGDRGDGRALREGADALEDAIEDHLTNIGNPQLLQQFRDARRLIAQTYSAQKAISATTGTVDARKLASQIKAGRPMTGQMRDAAEFADRFPKAAQPIEGMGSLPQTSPLDWALGGGMAAASSNPLLLASVMARPVVRSLTLSPIVQNRLVQNQGPNRLQQLLANSGASQLGYRAAPVLAAGL